MVLFSLLFSIFVSADYSQNKADILKVTGLTEKQIIAGTEADLESYLACSETGVSNGLEEFFVEGYLTATGEIGDKFTVLTEVTGPSATWCGATDTYMCYTQWVNYKGNWKVLGTECDYDEVAAD